MPLPLSLIPERFTLSHLAVRLLLRCAIAINSGSPDGLNKKCSGGDLSVYGRLRLRWMLSLQFMKNIAASLSCIDELYCMFLGLTRRFSPYLNEFNPGLPGNAAYLQC